MLYVYWSSYVLLLRRNQFTNTFHIENGQTGKIDTSYKKKKHIKKMLSKAKGNTMLTTQHESYQFTYAMAAALKRIREECSLFVFSKCKHTHTHSGLDFWVAANKNTVAISCIQNISKWKVHAIACSSYMNNNRNNSIANFKLVSIIFIF